ncbi:hypothetical protein DASC09_010730 [Saccharomycopsis crataegensis]|uniref:J domain-containing protein n=1 Tax=Saccharomycopsis crataegensis TaxID=43959 RepID=A0AAV5QHW5_9ASCO|nr:hypothetical protein DASC09_010730 [Saccharomycopsis crataegensis]
MINKADHYQQLGISKNSTASEIKSAYKKLALKYHPDKNKEVGAQEKFKLIVDSYNVLSDPTKKSEYDRKNDNSQQWSRNNYNAGNPYNVNTTAPSFKTWTRPKPSSFYSNFATSANLFESMKSGNSFSNFKDAFNFHSTQNNDMGEEWFRSSANSYRTWKSKPTSFGNPNVNSYNTQQEHKASKYQQSNQADNCTSQQPFHQQNEKQKEKKKAKKKDRTKQYKMQGNIYPDIHNNPPPSDKEDPSKNEVPNETIKTSKSDVDSNIKSTGSGCRSGSKTSYSYVSTEKTYMPRSSIKVKPAPQKSDDVDFKSEPMGSTSKSGKAHYYGGWADSKNENQNDGNASTEKKVKTEMKSSPKRKSSTSNTPKKQNLAETRMSPKSNRTAARDTEDFSDKFEKSRRESNCSEGTESNPIVIDEDRPASSATASTSSTSPNPVSNGMSKKDGGCFNYKPEAAKSQKTDKELKDDLLESLLREGENSMGAAYAKRPKVGPATPMKSGRFPDISQSTFKSEHPFPNYSGRGIRTQLEDSDSSNDDDDDVMFIEKTKYDSNNYYKNSANDSDSNHDDRNNYHPHGADNNIDGDNVDDNNEDNGKLNHETFGFNGTNSSTSELGTKFTCFDQSRFGFDNDSSKLHFPKETIGSSDSNFNIKRVNATVRNENTGDKNDWRARTQKIFTVEDDDDGDDYDQDLESDVEVRPNIFPSTNSEPSGSKKRKKAYIDTTTENDKGSAENLFSMPDIANIPPFTQNKPKNFDFEILRSSLDHHYKSQINEDKSSATRQTNQKPDFESSTGKYESLHTPVNKTLPFVHSTFRKLTSQDFAVDRQILLNAPPVGPQKMANASKLSWAKYYTEMKTYNQRWLNYRQKVDSYHRHRLEALFKYFDDALDSSVNLEVYMAGIELDQQVSEEFTRAQNAYMSAMQNYYGVFFHLKTHGFS